MGWLKRLSGDGACLFDHARVTSVFLTADGAAADFASKHPGSLTAKEVFLAVARTPRGHAHPPQKSDSHRLVHHRHRSSARALAAEVSPRNRMIYDSKHFLYYTVDADNACCRGARRVFPESESTVRESAELLRQGMGRSIPVSATQNRLCLGRTLDFAMDVMPHAGKIDGMYFAVGFAGPE